MNGQQIIDRFNLQVDDSSELSSEESLALANEVYQELQHDRNWEWLKAQHTGTTSTSVPYVALPTDFRNFCPNYSNSGLNFGSLGMPVGWSGYGYQPGASNASVSVVFVGDNYTPYNIISWSERRTYRNTGNVCYLDITNKRLYFTVQPTSAQLIEFDYIIRAPAITLSTSPLFNEAYHEIISYGMSAKFDPIQLTNKGESYQSINTQLYNQKLSNMRLEDVNIKTSLS